MKKSPLEVCRSPGQDVLDPRLATSCTALRSLWRSPGFFFVCLYQRTKSVTVKKISVYIIHTEKIHINFCYWIYFQFLINNHITVWDWVYLCMGVCVCLNVRVIVYACMHVCVYLSLYLFVYVHGRNFFFCCMFCLWIWAACINQLSICLFFPCTIRCDGCVSSIYVIIYRDCACWDRHCEMMLHTGKSYVRVSE